MSDQALPLQHWCVLSLRPRGQHAGLRAAAARLGARTLALSPFAIESLDAGRNALRDALAATIVVFTSPNAVASAAALQPLRHRRGQSVLAIGDGTRRALAHRGIEAHAPARMDSEGLLALPALRDVAGTRIGLVTGTGGRGVVEVALRARGATVRRADVYRRQPLELSPRGLRRLGEALVEPASVLLALSSGDALAQVLKALTPTLRERFADIAVSAASDRLAGVARDAGLHRIAVAADARPVSLLCAAAHAFAPASIV